MSVSLVDGVDTMSKENQRQDCVDLLRHPAGLANKIFPRKEKKGQLSRHENFR